MLLQIQRFRAGFCKGVEAAARFLFTQKPPPEKNLVKPELGVSGMSNISLIQ